MLGALCTVVLSRTCALFGGGKLSGAFSLTTGRGELKRGGALEVRREESEEEDRGAIM